MENLNLLLKNGSHSEIEISECDKLPPLKGISFRDSEKLGLRSFARRITIWLDQKEMIEGMMKDERTNYRREDGTTLYASKAVDNHGWTVDQGMIGSKILGQSKHTSKHIMSSTLRWCGDFQGFICSSLVVD